MSEPEQQRRRRGSVQEVVWLNAADIDEADFARVKAGAWLHIDPRILFFSPGDPLK